MCLCFSLLFSWNSLCSPLPHSIMLFVLVICFILCGPSVEDSISPQKDVQHAVEGAGVVLSCSYVSSVVSSLLWYRQYPGSPPQFLIMEYSGVITNPIPGMNITHIKKQRLVELQISSAAVTDSALYYCALRPTVTGNTDSLYKNLLSTKHASLRPEHRYFELNT
ncbi:unnamed protein product [Arctogadus glacialis]